MIRRRTSKVEMMVEPDAPPAYPDVPRDPTNAPGLPSLNRRGAIVALAIHSIAVVGCSLLVHSGLEQSHEAAGLWMLWMLIDFPVSTGAIPAEIVLSSMLMDAMGYDAFYTFGFGSYFLVAGGLQYYLLCGWLTARFAARRRFNDQP